MSRPRAILVGGASRVGLAVAKELASRGHDVIIGYRSGHEAAEACADAVRGNGVAASTHQFDLEDDASIRDFAELVGPEPVDVLIHAAGAFEEAALEDTSEQMFVEQFKVNASGPALLTAALRERLAASTSRDGACVLFFGDIHAEMVPRSGASAYLASKAATHALVRQLAIELAPTRVLGVAPGVVSWPEDWTQQRRLEYLQRVPLGREGTPDDVARLVGALVQDAGYVTGAVIPLDGGRHLR